MKFLTSVLVGIFAVLLILLFVPQCNREKNNDDSEIMVDQPAEPEPPVDEPVAGEPVHYDELDIVMCIDATGSMSSLLNKVKDNALNFSSDLSRKCETLNKHINRFRIRVLPFRDFSADGSRGIADSRFLNIPAQNSQFRSFMASIAADGGGDDPEDALEALAVAMQSPWSRSADSKCRLIILWTDADAHSLGVSSSAPSYPSGMPSSLTELKEWWDSSKMGGVPKRMVLFAPSCGTWNGIASSWDNVTHFPTELHSGLSDVDYNQMIEIIAAAL